MLYIGICRMQLIMKLNVLVYITNIVPTLYRYEVPHSVADIKYR